MKHLLHLSGVLLFFTLALPAASGQFVIDRTFGTSITSLSDAAAVEAGIDQAISRLEAAIATPITVNIDFENDSSIDLGESDVGFNFLPYSDYLSDLENNQVLSANDKTALASLPTQTDNPVDGDPNVELTLPLLRAIGESSLGDNGGGLDGTISLNLSEMYVSRGAVSSTEFDLQAVAAHEMDEVLGIGGAGSELAHGSTGAVGPMDLFRYSATGTRSYSRSGNISSYFSINGGATDLVHFNQDAGGDFGDWGNGATPAQEAGNTPPQVQDAYGDPGVNVNIGVNELTALDIAGYTLEAVPEPRSPLSLILGGLIAAGLRRRRGPWPDPNGSAASVGSISLEAQ